MLRLRCLLLLVAVMLPFFGCARVAPVSFEALCMDVGQGACILLRTPEGDILVDAGPESAQERLLPRLRALGVERLALLIFTHADEDHIGGGDALLRELEVDRVWYNGESQRTDSMERLERAMTQAGITPTAAVKGTGFHLGALTVTVLSPDERIDGNAGSLVLRLHSNGFTGLIMGDADGSVEKRLLESYGADQLRSELLFVGHHGSNDGSTADFLSAVQPSYAMICCGAGNAYGSPDGRVLSRLEAVGARILRTDLMGELGLRQTKEGDLTVVTEE